IVSLADSTALASPAGAFFSAGADPEATMSCTDGLGDLRSCLLGFRSDLVNFRDLRRRRSESFKRFVQEAAEIGEEITPPPTRSGSSTDPAAAEGVGSAAPKGEDGVPQTNSCGASDNSCGESRSPGATGPVSAEEAAEEDNFHAAFTAEMQMHQGGPASSGAKQEDSDCETDPGMPELEPASYKEGASWLEVSRSPATGSLGSGCSSPSSPGGSANKFGKLGGDFNTCWGRGALRDALNRQEDESEETSEVSRPSSEHEAESIERSHEGVSILETGPVRLGLETGDADHPGKPRL
ncbi:unnamed protein product, partial [Polarella glacialis]